MFTTKPRPAGLPLLSRGCSAGFPADHDLAADCGNGPGGRLVAEIEGAEILAVEVKFLSIAVIELPRPCNRI